MRTFLNYLDHHTGVDGEIFNKYGFKERQYKYDRLAQPDGTFFAAGPAVAKSDAALLLVMRVGTFDHRNSIRLVLPPSRGPPLVQLIRTKPLS